MTDDVRRMENAALVFSCAVCALAEIEGMRSENRLREIQGASPAYGQEQFDEVVDGQRIGWNRAQDILRRE